MSEDVKVQIELDKFKAESSLRDLSRQLNAADQLINQMKRSGVTWAEDFQKAVASSRKQISTLGTVASKATDQMIKGNDSFAKSLNTIYEKVQRVNDGLQAMGRNFLLTQNASRIPATASLRDDNEKRRQQYMAKQQQSYLKEQSSLARHSAQLATIRQNALAKQQAQLQARNQAREQFNALERQALKRQETAINSFWQRVNSGTQAKDTADKLKSIKQLYIDLQRTSAASHRSTASLGGAKAVADALREQARLNRQAAIESKKKSAADREAAKNQLDLTTAAKRLTTVGMSQAGMANRLGASWRLFKQELRETISVANIFQTTARGLTAVMTHLGQGLLDIVRLGPNLSSEFLGFRNALALVAGTQEEATKLLNTAVQIAVNLRLSISAVTKEYSKFTNAATIAGLSIEQATKTFEDYAIAARVLNLTPERTSGMFLALEQMISKGRVSMEELRRQLGEHIPGALNLAAQAMGYGKDELGKFIKEVSNGNVVSTELVTKLGDLVRKRTMPQLAASLRKFSAAVQAVRNQIELLSLKIGDALNTVLVPLLDGIEYIIAGFNDWLPATSTLGNTQEALATSIQGVNEVTETTAAVFENVSNIQKVLSGDTVQVARSFDDLKESVSGASYAMVGMLGIVGASGLGGVFVALRKAVGWVAAGLTAFLAPFSRIATTARAIGGFLGAAGLSGIVTKLGGAFAWLTAKITGFLSSIAVFALVHPLAAAAAAAAGVATAIWASIDPATELDDTIRSAEQSFKRADLEAKNLTDQAGELRDAMFAIGQDPLAVKLDTAKNRIDNIRRYIGYLQDSNRYLEGQKSFWDEAAESVGVTTDHASELQKQIAENQRFIHLLELTLSESKETMKGLAEEATNASAAMKTMKEEMQRFLDLADLRTLELNVELERSGVSDVERQVALIRNKFHNERIKLEIESPSGTLTAAEENQLSRMEELESTLVRLKEANKNATDAMRDFEQSSNSLSKSLTSTITSLDQQRQTFGLTGVELQKLNDEFKIAELQSQLQVVASKATTTAMKEKIAVMEQQIIKVRELQAANRQLMDQEELRQIRLKDQNEQVKTMLDLQKKGHDLLKGSMTIHQQYAIRVREIVPALEAVGASQLQVSQVLQTEWNKIVDASNTGLKSLEAITEEVAKNMQNSFSEFFFNAMEGNFDNMVDSFNNALRRMIADAMAAQLSRYVMSGFGGAASSGGVFGSLVSGLVTGLGGTGAAPAVSTAAPYQTAGGFFVNLHKGGMVTEGAVPRYHDGVGPREQAAILRKDEGVFTPGQMASLASLQDVRAASGGNTSVTFAPTINVDARNAENGVEETIAANIDKQMADTFNKFKSMNSGMRLSNAQTGTRLASVLQNAQRNA